MKDMIEKVKSIFKRKPKAAPKADGAAAVQPIAREIGTPETGIVYVGVDTQHPHIGLSTFNSAQPAGPSICIEGVSMDRARMELCGKVIDWSRMAPKRMEAITVEGKITLSFDELKSLFK